MCITSWPRVAIVSNCGAAFSDVCLIHRNQNWVVFTHYIYSSYFSWIQLLCFSSITHTSGCINNGFVHLYTNTLKETIQPPPSMYNNLVAVSANIYSHHATILLFISLGILDMSYIVCLKFCHDRYRIPTF
jgi:hypothetical protein